MSFWVTDLKETSIDVGVVVDGAVLVVAHNLDHLLMQLCSCSVMQARRPRCRGKVWKIKRTKSRVWCLTIDHTSTQSLLFVLFDKVFVPQRLWVDCFVEFVIWFVWRALLQSNCGNFSFFAPNVCPSGSPQKT